MKTLLLRFIHHLITLGEFVKCIFLFIPYLDGFSFTKKSTLSIQADSKSLKKIPTHLGLIIAEDDFCFRDLANIVVWAVTMGISYISIYDVNGEIKRRSRTLEENIDEASDQVMGSNKSSYDIQLFSSTQACKATSAAGSTSKARQARVCLLCMEDGQKGIVGVAKKLGEMVSAGMYRLDDIVPSNIDAFLMESLSLPDPELCLKFGATFSLMGYLPWHVRLTEFVFLPSHKGFTYKSFLSSLCRFANTSQRFGK